MPSSSSSSESFIDSSESSIIVPSESSESLILSSSSLPDSSSSSESDSESFSSESQSNSSSSLSESNSSAESHSSIESASSDDEDEPPPEPCCDCDCEKPESQEDCPDDGSSGEPVKYGTGQMVHKEIDLSANAFGIPWGHTRSYANVLLGSGGNGTSFNGNRWYVRQLKALSFKFTPGTSEPTSGLDSRTTLSRITPHRLRALVLEDVGRYPGSSSSEINRRIGAEISLRTLRRALEGLASEERITCTGDRRWRRYWPGGQEGD